MFLPARLMKNTVVIMLFLVLISKGILCMISNPPWQTADEPMFLEAALVTGSGFPDQLTHQENAAPEIQHAILKCLTDHQFFDRVGVPWPNPQPTTFRDTVFLRDAPSKLGREPLFYLLTGIPLATFTDGLLEALYLGRLICFCIALAGFYLFFLSLQRLFPDSYLNQILPLFIVTFQPVFWQFAASMTAESWKFFLICLGLYLLARRMKFRSLAISVAVATGYLLAIVLTRWTLIPIALPLLIAAIARHPARKNTVRTIHAKARWRYTAFGMGGVLLLGFLTMSPHLLKHELRHIHSGLHNLLHTPGQILPLFTRLTETFWYGFGWLNIPASATTQILAWLLTLILGATIGVYVVSGASRTFRRKNPQWLVVTLTLTLLMGMIVIRANSSDPAIQGRYLFPVLPLLAIASSRAITYYRRLAPVASLVVVTLLTCTDLSANITGWFHHQHVSVNNLDSRAWGMDALTWKAGTSAKTVLGATARESDSFLVAGWYPAEPGSNYRWMLNHSIIALPLLPHQESTLSLDFTVFAPDPAIIREMKLIFNGHTLCTRQISHRDHSVSIHLPRAIISSNVNLLELFIDKGLSPSALNLSSDSRFLTIALKQLEIIPRSFLGKESQEYSTLCGWKVTNQSSFKVHWNSPGDIALECLDPGDHLELITDTEVQRLWWDESFIERIEKTTDSFSDIKLVRNQGNMLVNRFYLLAKSVGHIPRPFNDVYLHILLLCNWIFWSIFPLILLGIQLIVSPLLDHRITEC